MAPTLSAWVRRGSLKESGRKRKRRLLKINISPEMNGVFVCFFILMILWLCAYVCLCVTVWPSHYISHPQQTANFCKCARACAWYKKNTFSSIYSNVSMQVGVILDFNGLRHGRKTYSICLCPPVWIASKTRLGNGIMAQGFFTPTGPPAQWCSITQSCHDTLNINNSSRYCEALR